MIVRNRNSSSAYTLRTEVLVPAKLETVFAFFADPHNLNFLTPPWLSFSILTPSPIEMQTGARLDYRLKLHGIPIGWKTEITDWEPPNKFVDMQIQGPYRLWRHEHTFLEQHNGTLVIDNVDYTVPGGPIVHWMFVKRDVERIFDYRHQQLLEQFAVSS